MTFLSLSNLVEVDELCVPIPETAQPMDPEKWGRFESGLGSDSKSGLGSDLRSSFGSNYKRNLEVDF